jgi:hypothetical protein
MQVRDIAPPDLVYEILNIAGTKNGTATADISVLKELLSSSASGRRVHQPTFGPQRVG